MSAAIEARRDAFKALHRSGCFVIPNPWDAGSARYLASLGFKALATTSSGYAWAQGRADGSVPRAGVLAYLRTIVEATELPVNADFEAGYVTCARFANAGFGLPDLGFTTPTEVVTHVTRIAERRGRSTDRQLRTLRR